MIQYVEQQGWDGKCGTTDPTHHDGTLCFLHIVLAVPFVDVGDGGDGLGTSLVQAVGLLVKVCYLFIQLLHQLQSDIHDSVCMCVLGRAIHKGMVYTAHFQNGNQVSSDQGNVHITNEVPSQSLLSLTLSSTC